MYWDVTIQMDLRFRVLGCWSEVWRCWCKLEFSLVANWSFLWEPKLTWNARADLMWSSNCISSYLNREWDAIMLHIVNHFRLVQFKAKLWCSHFTGSTTCLFKTTSPFQPYHSRNKVHQLDPVRNPPALCIVHHCSSLCSSIAGYSQILLSPKALNSRSPCSSEWCGSPVPPQPRSCHPWWSIPDAVTTMWVAMASRTRELI